MEYRFSSCLLVKPLFIFRVIPDVLFFIMQYKAAHRVWKNMLEFPATPRKCARTGEGVVGVIYQCVGPRSVTAYTNAEGPRDEEENA